MCVQYYHPCLCVRFLSYLCVVSLSTFLVCIPLYTCTHVYVFVSLSVCLYIHLPLQRYTSVYMFVYLFVCVYLCLPAHVCKPMSTYVRHLSIIVYISACMFIPRPMLTVNHFSCAGVCNIATFAATITSKKSATAPFLVFFFLL